MTLYNKKTRNPAQGANTAGSGNMPWTTANVCPYGGG